MQTLAAAGCTASSRIVQQVQQLSGTFRCRALSSKDSPDSPLEAETQAAEEAGNIPDEEASSSEAALQKTIEEKDQMVRNALIIIWIEL